MENRPLCSNQSLLKTAFIIFLLFACVFSEDDSKIDFSRAGRIIVLDEGRKMPLHSYARKKLIQISGRGKIGGMSALEWLLELMFNPGKIDTLQCFRIINPETVDALGIEGPYKRRYRYTELYNALGKCEQIAISLSKREFSEIQPFEREIMQLWHNVQEYNALGSMFSAFDPFEAFTISDSALASSLRLRLNHPYSYSEMIRLSHVFSAAMENLNSKQLDSLTSGESELLRLVRTMHALSSQMQNAPPPIIHVNENGNEEWYSIWGYLGKSGNKALKDNQVRLLLHMRAAYLNRDVASFADAVDHLTSVKYKDYPFPGLEILYNRLNLFFWARILLVLAIFATLFGMFYGHKWAGVASLFLIGCGWLLQTTDLILRIFIQLRPPLASLYETFVFVSWIIVILGTGLDLIQKRNLGKLIASCGGFLFLVISGRYAVNGDTFGVITAVLNSSFWLTIHIVTISTGYAGFLASGLLGHIHLIQRALKTDKKVTQSTSEAVYIFMLLGLAFTVAGTMLGGMWADQAWGRFWGWDPKENGALLIILWGSAVVHAKRGKIIGSALTSACAVISILMVMLAWIGVNLLGVGLHSYGFTYSGIGLLAGVFVLEFLFLVSMGFLNRSSEKEPA